MKAQNCFCYQCTRDKTVQELHKLTDSRWTSRYTTRSAKKVRGLMQVGYTGGVLVPCAQCTLLLQQAQVEPRNVYPHPKWPIKRASALATTLV